MAGLSMLISTSSRWKPTAESSATANLPTEICLTWSPTSCTPARSIMLLNYIVTCHTVTILPSGETGKNWARHRLKAGTSALPTTCMYTRHGTTNKKCREIPTPCLPAYQNISLNLQSSGLRITRILVYVHIDCLEYYMLYNKLANLGHNDKTRYVDC